jgi:primosomal protein N' (replication factor Y) (superfamily II helicase)
MRLVRVAVPVPALGSLTYSVPDDYPAPVVGARVLVPLGSRVMTGCVVDSRGSGLGARSSDVQIEIRKSRVPNTIKPLIDILDDEPFLPPEIVNLTAWVAEYYAAGVGDAMAAAMPPRAWIESERHAQITDAGHARLLTERGRRRAILEALSGDKPVSVEKLSDVKRGGHATLIALEREGLIALTQPLRGAASAFRTVRVASLTAQGLDIVQSTTDDGLKLGGRQRQALEMLQGSPGGLETGALAERGITAQTLSRLSSLGLISFNRRRVERDPFGQAITTPARTSDRVELTSEQSAAFEKLRTLATTSRFQAALLHGVTGSGKTEVYLRLAEDVRRAGRSVLLLVPEIALTPSAAGIFRIAFGDRVAIQHSGLSDGERYDQWHRIRRGDVDVVVGTRSAVFAPLRSLGLIVVDEEHDGSYKQEETPRYNGRDVAVMRAREAGALVVLGSATPSMESYQNALNGRYALVTLEKRVLDRPLAEVRIVDMREEYAASGPDVILSRELADALAARLQRREQAIVLLNRRGYASSVFCRQCASTLECPNCSVSLTVHRAARRARCHYCNYSMALPKACLTCAGPFLEQIGFGTERVEAEITARFPEARTARVDRDTVRKRGAIAALLSRFAAGELDVLVGTQMIAKGHDFPRVSLVGVISADVGLGLADFRAAERTFQLLTQVAGRAGRGDIRGQAVVQTLYPDHYSIRHACRQDYTSFFADEVNYRRAMRYPPAVALVNVVVKGRTLAAAMHDAGEIAQALRSRKESYRVLGPATAPLSRIKGEHRAQLFLKGTHRTSMREALVEVLAGRPELRRRTIIDIDPLSVL